MTSLSVRCGSDDSGPPQQMEFNGAVAVLQQVTLDREDEVRARQVPAIPDQQPVADLSGGDDVDRLLQRRHAGVLRRGDPLDLLGRLDPAPLLVDVGSRAHVDVVLAQVIGEHGGKLGVDVDRVEAVFAAHRGHQVRPADVLVAAGTRRRDLELHGAAHRAHGGFLTGTALLERAHPEHGVAPASIDDYHRVGYEESGPIQDVRVVIGLTEEQDGTVVTHVAERTSPVSGSRRERDT